MNKTLIEGSGPAETYRALVVGASGALGAAFVSRFQADPACAEVATWQRQGDDAVDLTDEASIARAAQRLSDRGPWHRVIVATGILHGPGLRPEKRLADLSPDAMAQVFRVNVFGPALVLKHVAPLLDRQSARVGLLSAKVGSIGDNRLGGWTSYRASKAALNMVIRTVAIEWRRTHPGVILAALHPGTVRSALSRPFRGDEIGRDPALAVQQMLEVLEGLSVEESGCFRAYDGQALPW